MAWIKYLNFQKENLTEIESSYPIKLYTDREMWEISQGRMPGTRYVPFDQSQALQDNEPLSLIYNQSGNNPAKIAITNEQNIDGVLDVLQTRTSTDGAEDGGYDYKLGDNTNVRITTVPGEITTTNKFAWSWDKFELGDNSTLELTSTYIEDVVRNLWDLYTEVDLGSYPTINMGEGNSTLIYDDRNIDEYISKQPESFYPKITGLTPGDKIIIPGASRGEYVDGYLNFYNADGQLLSKLNVQNNSEEALSQIQFNDGTMSIACFLKGTHITTPDGEVKVESLKAGDEVLTANGTVATVKWLGYRTLHKTRIPDKDIKRSFPVLFKKGCIADNIPARDLFISPGHHVFFDGNLVPAMALINGKSIVQQFHMKSFQYFHIELEQFGILLAEGVPSESYVDTGNRNMFQNADEVALNPDFGPTEGRPDVPGITVLRKGPIVEAIKAKLLKRANCMRTPEVQQRTA